MQINPTVSGLNLGHSAATKKSQGAPRNRGGKGLDPEAAFKARYGVASREWYERLSRLVAIPRIGHLMAACADPSGGFKPAAERRKILREIAMRRSERAPFALTIRD